MGKSSITRTAAPAPHTVPLSEITITWRRPKHFFGEPDDAAVTITGGQLAEVLASLAYVTPTGEWEAHTDPQRFIDELESVEAIARSLSAGHMDDPNEVLFGLSCLVGNLTASLVGQARRDKVLETATVTIERRPSSSVKGAA